MASPVPELAPRVAEVLDALSASGITPTAAEIVWLAKLREPCDRPTGGGIPPLSGAPLQYGGVTFWPMHRLAETWFLRAYKLLDGVNADQVAAFLYAHAHSAPGDASLRMVVTLDAIRTALREWMDGVAIHNEELPEICDELRRINRQRDTVPDVDQRPTDDDDSIGDVPQFVAAMCKVFPGVSPDYWMTGIAGCDARDMMQSAVSGGCNFATSADRTEAQRNFLRAVKWVWRNHANG